MEAKDIKQLTFIPEIPNHNEEKLLFEKTSYKESINGKLVGRYQGIYLQLGEETPGMVLSVTQTVKLYRFLKEFLKNYPVELTELSSINKN